MSLSPSLDTRDRIRRSALWAAYGDALGFITEGVDSNGVSRRAGGPRVEQTVAWKRRVGGKFGPTVELPAGCISDDTQLRLATSRSVRGQAHFDIETFAKIELTVWPAYALGAGKGSQVAAANLRRRDVTWATNFFAGDRAHYLQGGGNGAAMRIQPHVWAHPAAGDRRELIADVVTNAVATHGHPRGILGAVFHARCLLHTLDHGEVPGPDDWDAIAHELTEVGAIAELSSVLGELWLGQWEVHTGRLFSAEVEAVAREISTDLRLCRGLNREDGVGGYSSAVEALQAFRVEQRGSGTKTSILAAVAAWLFSDRPLDAVLACANRLGTDTDTIATMAGAIVGVVALDEPEGSIADRDYIVHEADRMWAISQGASVSAFQYPNLVTWIAPKSASDCVGLSDDTLEITGLGSCEADSEEFAPNGKPPAVWQWLTLWFGQRVLAKRRPRLTGLASSQSVRPSQQYLLVATPQVSVSNGHATPPPEVAPVPVNDASVASQRAELDLHELTNRVIASNFDPAVVGAELLKLADHSNGIELALGYAAIITKARQSRLDKERRSNGS